MGTEEVLKKIRSRDGVLDAFVIDEDGPDDIMDVFSDLENADPETTED